MKTITPVSVWHEGVVVNANTFNLYVVHNDLETTAKFYYDLSFDGLTVASGTLTMAGTDYTNYNSNSYAWNWAATQLGLTII